MSKPMIWHKNIEVWVLKMVEYWKLEGTIK